MNIDLRSPDVVQLSRQLLGYRLCTLIDGQLTSGIIVETEAYRAPEDKASHAYNGRRTSRTETIFSEGGVSYVYLCYGIHSLFNVVSGPADTAHAILVRALQPETGIDLMKVRRGPSVRQRHLTSGPGKLCQALGITREMNGKVLYKDVGSGIWLEPGIEILPSLIKSAKRVGVDYADEWKEKLWRFYISGDPNVSVI